MYQNTLLLNSLAFFKDFPPLEAGMTLAGYGALIKKYNLTVPFPDYLCAINVKHKMQAKDQWRLFTPRHKPVESLYGHLVFALKYEGIDLAVLKALFAQIKSKQIEDIVRSEPTGYFSRRIWFLYEWLMETQLNLADIKKGNYVPVIDEKLQYPGPARISKRHRVRNNLPGIQAFCPLIRRTDKIDKFIAMNLAQAVKDHVGETHGDLLRRAAAFLLIKDSKASYKIEGETPPHKRIERWGRIIGDAGKRNLSVAELEYLQSVVIGDNRFTKLGCRTEEGFIGEHDRINRTPIPVHISARHTDLNSLLSGLLETNQLLMNSKYDAVLAATLIAFGFVFIHPFEDGNGRIHRYLFHHVLVKNGFISNGWMFPVSAIILDRLEDYVITLENYSKPRLELIDWRSSEKGNVEILNATIDLYRYFDATKQAEFFFECVEETINKTLPEEVDYLRKHNLLVNHIKNEIEMPDSLVDLLIRFLNQNNGTLSKRARNREFAKLTENETTSIENKYQEIFNPKILN